MNFCSMFLLLFSKRFIPTLKNGFVKLCSVLPVTGKPTIAGFANKGHIHCGWLGYVGLTWNASYSKIQ